MLRSNISSCTRVAFRQRHGNSIGTRQATIVAFELPAAEFVSAPLRFARSGEPAQFVAPQNGPNAREQFSEAERLGHIVVRAQLEAHDTIDFLQPVTGGDDHGDVRVGSNLSEQIEPIFAPQSQIENDQARLTHGEMASQVLPAGRGTRRDVMLFEVTGDHPPRGRIVIDNRPHSRRFSINAFHVLIALDIHAMVGAFRLRRRIKRAVRVRAVERARPAHDVCCPLV